eukprot:6209992-Pleurochrysis_carterae.AAC.3
MNLHTIAPVAQATQPHRAVALCTCPTLCWIEVRSAAAICTARTSRQVRCECVNARGRKHAGSVRSNELEEQPRFRGN